MKPHFKSIGKNCKISEFARFYNSENISIGDNVRIDDFCVLSGGSELILCDNIHIACYVSMFAGSGIILNDFCNVAAYSILLSESDDFSGQSLIGPTIPMKYKPAYKKGEIIFDKHVIIGARSTILPGVYIGEGVAVGACSLVNKSLDSWNVYAGVPVKLIKERKKDMLILAENFMNEVEY